MLFGTYQKFPYNNQEKICNALNAPRKFFPELNFSPVWAFPITSMNDFFVQSTFSSPSFPELLYIFESDNYTRINKIKWYKDIKDNKFPRDIRNYIDNTIPDEISEFIFRPENVFCNIKQIVNITSIPQFVNGACKLNDIFVSKVNLFPQELESYFIEKMLFILNNVKIDFADRENLIKGSINIRKLSEKGKLLFESCLLPFAFNLLLLKETPAYWVESFSTNIRQRARISNEFLTWAYTDCTEKEYIRLYNELKKLPIGNESVLRFLSENKKNNRNAPCPCGSGIKFKKCHGKLIIG